MKEKTIIRLLWIAFGIKVFSFLLVAIITFAQGMIKSIVYPNWEEVVQGFCFPADRWIMEITGCLFMLLACCMISNSLKKRNREIVTEILGAILFCGVSGWVSNVLSVAHNYIVNILQGAKGVAASGFLNSCFVLVHPVSVIGSAVFLVAVGMSIAYKKGEGLGEA